MPIDPRLPSAVITLCAAKPKIPSPDQTQNKHREDFGAGFRPHCASEASRGPPDACGSDPPRPAPLSGIPENETVTPTRYRNPGDLGP